MKIGWIIGAVCAAASSAGAQAGWVDDHVEISSISGGFTGDLGFDDRMSVVASLGDLDGDGLPELAVGTPGDDDGGRIISSIGTGAVWVLFLGADGEVRRHTKISATQGGFSGVLEGKDGFGTSVTAVGDLDGDGVSELAVGAPGIKGQSGERVGAVWILFLRPTGHVEHDVMIPAWPAFLPPTSGPLGFGTALAGVGDVDGDGVPDLAVSAPGGTQTSGSVWLLFLRPDGTVKSHQQIAPGPGVPQTRGDLFGAALGALGDHDRDGVPDLAVGSPLYDVPGDESGRDQGAITLLHLRTDGTVSSAQVIAPGLGGFTGDVHGGARFGSAVAAVGDVDFDGRPDLAVGAPDDFKTVFGNPTDDPGSVWILFTGEDGTVRGHQQITDGEGWAYGILDPFDAFGTSIAPLGDFDGDGAVDLAVGAKGYEALFEPSSSGATFVLFLDEVPPPGTWTDLGGGLAVGPGDPPLLTGNGLIAPGKKIKLRLEDGPLIAPVMLVAGLDQVWAPFKGGVLVPSPDLLVPGMTGPLLLGIETFNGTWVGLEPVVFQVWAVNDQGPGGYEVSNALLAEPGGR